MHEGCSGSLYGSVGMGQWCGICVGAKKSTAIRVANICYDRYKARVKYSIQSDGGKDFKKYQWEQHIA